VMEGLEGLCALRPVSELTRWVGRRSISKLATDVLISYSRCNAEYASMMLGYGGRRRRRWWFFDMEFEEWTKALSKILSVGSWRRCSDTISLSMRAEELADVSVSYRGLDECVVDCLNFLGQK